MTSSFRGELRERLHRTIPSCLESAESLCLEIRRFVQTAGLAQISFPIELLARECLTNAVIHGNAAAADKTVDLTLSIGRIWIRIAVSDQGSGFPWRKARNNQPNGSATSGRGLQICALYADRVRFNRSGNAVVLWIRKYKPSERNAEHGGIQSETRQ